MASPDSNLRFFLSLLTIYYEAMVPRRGSLFRPPTFHSCYCFRSRIYISQSPTHDRSALCSRILRFLTGSLVRRSLQHVSPEYPMTSVKVVNMDLILTSYLISRSLNAAGCALIAAIGFIALATLPPDAYVVGQIFPSDCFDTLVMLSFHAFLAANASSASIRHAHHVLRDRLLDHTTSALLPCLKHPLYRLHRTCRGSQSHARRWSWPPAWCLDLQTERCQGRVQEWQLAEWGIYARDRGYLRRIEVVVW